MSWQDSTLGELAKLDGGLIQTGPFGSQLHQAEYETEGIPVVMPKDISDGRISTKSVARISEQTATRLQRHKLKPRSIVLPRRGEVTKRAYIREEQEGWICGTGCLKIELHGRHLVPEYLYYFMEQEHVTKWLLQHAVGTTMLNLSAGIVSALPIRYPSPDAQTALADILSTYDDLIENNRRRMALLEESARLLYREWFVRLRFPGHEHTPIVDGVPQGWERKTLELVCLSGNGIQTGPFGSQLHQADYSEDGVPVVMPKDLIGFRVSTSSIARIPESLADSLGRNRMIPGDTVYGRRGDIGRRAFIGKRQLGWFCGTGSLRIRPNPQVINPLYLFDYLGTPAAVGDITNRAKGSTMLNLSAAALKPVPVLVPSRTLQEMYAEQINQVREMVEVLDEQNQKLRTARDLLLPRLMSGELAV